MRIKVDENLGHSAVERLRTRIPDTRTVFDQHMLGSSDRHLADVCAQEERVLISLDLDLANPLVFPPEKSRGLVVLRPGVRYSLDSIAACINTFLKAIDDGLNPDRSLWIIQPDRIRVLDREANP